MQNFITNLNSNLKEVKTFSDIIFLCIGTNKIIGDAFGPIVGQKLKYEASNLENVKVIGDLDNCIVYQDIEKIEKEIYEQYENPYIICIDAALSKTIKQGQIVVEKKGMQIGTVLGKKEKSIGDLSIKGIVAGKCENYKENFIALTKVPLGVINLMAKKTVNGIKDVYLFQNWKEFN